MTPILRELLAAALDLAPTEVDGFALLAHVSAIGRSHVEPGLRLFAHRGATPVASIKRMPRPSAAVRDRIVGCYARLAGGDVFQVPALLAWREDDAHLYLVESVVPGRPLADLLAADAIGAGEAADRLDAVLRDLWARGTPASPADIEHQADQLRRAAIVLFEDQRARDLVDAVLTTLRERHPEALRRVLTTRDVHSFNVHVDDAGQTWLTDFDLTDEVVFFGLDVVRTWVHSALAPPAPSTFLSPAAYRLHEAIYPIYEYALQAPLLPDAEREGLRAYAQDLFVRLNLPGYHRAAVAQPAPLIGPAPEAQVGFTDVDGDFQEAASLRIPFDLASGRARLTTVIRSERPLRAVRLSPINLAHSVVTVQRWTVAPLGAPDAVLDAAQYASGGNGTGAHLTHLLPLPGQPRTFFAAANDPLIVVPVDADPGVGTEGHVYALDVDLSLMRHWVFAPGFDPALLLGRLQAHIESLDAARAYEIEHARDQLAEERTQARDQLAEVRTQGRDQLADERTQVRQARRLARRLATQLSVEPGPPPVPPAALAAFRERVQRLPRSPRVLAGIVAAEALRRWRGAPPPAAPAAGLIPVARPGRVWAPPHVAVLVDGDGEPHHAGDALAWAAQQTCGSTEVIVWSRTDELAWDAREPDAQWRATDWPALHATLAARYVVFASADLFAQATTYLERALLALEPEDLSFAITVGAALPTAATAIATGRGPGGSGDILPRTVARPEIVTETGTLDLDAARAERGAAGGALGKLLGDTGAPPDARPAFAVPLVGAPVGVLGAYVVADPTPGATMLHPIAAADRVLDLPPLPSDLPTVIMVFPFLAVGGAERVHLDVVRGLRDRIRFVIAAIEPHDDRLGTTVAAFRALTPYVYTAPDALHPLLTTSFFEHLFRRFAPRTLYIANGSAWIYDALPTLKAMYPRLRTVDQVYDIAAGWIERMDGPTLAAVDAHISCNRHISAALVERGAAPDAAVTVHNAPDLSLFDPAAFDAERRAALAERFGLPPGRRVVAFIGRMHQQKRPMDVVELARQLRGDSRLAFLMVGDGPLAETVRAQVATSGLDNLSVHAFHQPSSECYAVADVLLLPSEYEGMPMVILEALAMGVPVVATDVGNNREVLTRTGGGRIVDRVGDVPALRQAVLATLDAPADPAALRAAVEREFGMSAMLDAYARVLLGD